MSILQRLWLTVTSFWQIQRGYLQEMPINSEVLNDKEKYSWDLATWDTAAVMKQFQLFIWLVSLENMSL